MPDARPELPAFGRRSIKTVIMLNGVSHLFLQKQRFLPVYGKEAR
jgi:hypothetical protein